MKRHRANKGEIKDLGSHTPVQEFISGSLFRDVTFFVVVLLVANVSNPFAIPWTVAPQVPLSMEFPRQEYWTGLLLPSPGDLPDPRIEPASLAWQAGSLPLSHQGSP